MLFFTLLFIFIGLLCLGPFIIFLATILNVLLNSRFVSFFINFFSLKSFKEETTSSLQVHYIFFKTTFITMGRLAKIDGRINQQEIEQATYWMNNMNLNKQQRLQAIEFFNQGKAGLVDFTDILYHFKETCVSAKYMHIFLEMQLYIAYADGVITSSEKKFLEYICCILDISQFTLDLLSRRVQMQQRFYHYSYENSQYDDHHQSSRSFAHEDIGYRNLTHAYRILSVSASSTDVEIKRAYRKLMSMHHPDKAIATGSSKENLEKAKRKTQQIQAAYDLIQGSRKKEKHGNISES